MTTVHRAKILSSFTCLGDRCEDTCCRNWSMQVDENTIQRYRSNAPELIEAVETSPDAPWIMRKNAETSECVKLDGGLCTIYKQYGDRFLGDACHFYPRVTRNLGEIAVMSATMSCPEIVRLALSSEDPCEAESVDIDRLPMGMRDYCPEGITAAEGLSVHEAFLKATEDETATAEHILLRIASASRSFERIEAQSWFAMAEYYLQHADTRIPQAEKNPADPFNLLHALCGLIVATHKFPSQRLRYTIEGMESALKARLDWQQVLIQTSDESIGAYAAIQQQWQSVEAFYAPILRRWLQMQMSFSLYPYSGLGGTLTERITIIGVRLATVKLALQCNHHIHGGAPTSDQIVTVIQSLSRFLDHLGDPTFSIQIYSETGWTLENRMCGLLL